jgi:hypothetical protein
MIKIVGGTSSTPGQLITLVTANKEGSPEREESLVRALHLTRQRREHELTKFYGTPANRKLCNADELSRAMEKFVFCSLKFNSLIFI